MRPQHSEDCSVEQMMTTESSQSHSIYHEKMAHLERKVVSSICSRQKRRPRRRRTSGTSSARSCASDDASEFGASSSYGGSSIGTGVSSHDGGSAYDSEADEMKNLTISVPRLSFGDYTTIDQKEFFTECMAGDGGCQILHFFSTGSPTSMMLDNHMETLAPKFEECRFLRIDGSEAPFVCSKLQITKCPTILVLSNRVVLDKYSPDDEDDASEEAFSEWLMTTVPKIREDDFDESLRQKEPYAGHLDDLDDEDYDVSSRSKGVFAGVKTLDQNEFFMECLVNGYGMQIVHVIEEESDLSILQDGHIEALSKDFTHCQFLRIHGDWTRFVVARLHLEKCPALVVFKNRKVLGQYSPKDAATSSSQALKDWILQLLFKVEMQLL